MVTESDHVTGFGEEINTTLKKAGEGALSPPVVQRLLGRIATRCQVKKVSVSFLLRLATQLKNAGIHTEPPLNASGLRRTDRIRFSTRAFPIPALLFEKERGLQDFVRACIGVGPFRDLVLFKDGRKPHDSLEFRLPGRLRIDILCEQKARSGRGDLVAIELKRGKQPGTVEQLRGYIDALRVRFPNRNVRGIIITGHDDALATTSLEATRDRGYTIDWYCYDVKFNPVHPAT